MESSDGGERIVHALDEGGRDDEDGEDNEKKTTVTPTGRRELRPVSCQVENCSADMSNAKPYHRRHKVCEFHAKAPAVVLSGRQQRFCQQCNRFHEISEFDEAKRSCRRRLAGHNERRRKNLV